LLIQPLPVVGAPPNEESVAEELKSLEDPSILRRRVSVDTEWNSFKDSSDDVEFTIARLWAWQLSPNQDWAVRINVPLKIHRAGSNTSDSDREGLGDIKAAVGTAFRFSKTLRAAGGLEMRFPTASDDLGSNVWRPMLFAVVGWDAAPRVTLSTSAEYNKSIKEENGARREHFLELFFPATFLLEHRWAVTPRYEMKIDFADNDKLTHSGKLSITKELKDRPLAFTLSIKKTFDGAEKRVQMNFVATHFLR
jgi:hypothetical protein